MLSLKSGVTVAGLHPQMILAVIAAHDLYGDYGADLVITSGNDGRHSETSLHYNGCALDLRTRNLANPEADGPEIAGKLKEALGRDFDVLFEGNHIHIEYQPRRPS